ncbi:MAG: cupredoxin family protein [Roseitalea sp.]|nr:cupredoxin family protein [Roseitalea sp.]MBO6720681.1 cupredoxin family protein [Roseitalea sp.]MBO6743828.1 cupredoxin family protein [Roseitalea sp.]
MRRLLTIAMSVVFATTALAQEMHEGKHDSATAHSMGKSASLEAATRTIEVSMLETEDGRMVFEPGLIEVQPGETVRFAISNVGLIEHEFVFDTPAEIIAHKDEMMMDAAHDMAHDSDNAITLQPGEDGELAWTFTDAGVFEFACLIPGHYEAGMFGPLVVRPTMM